MITVEQVKAFTEYVLRPLSDDLRQILEKAKELNLPISEAFIMGLSTKLVRSHLISECIRAISYVSIASIVCWTCYHVLR